MSRASRSTSPLVRSSLILLAALPAPLAAQAVLAGRTLSDSTKDPLPGVEVVLESEKDSTLFGGGRRVTFRVLKPF